MLLACRRPLLGRFCDGGSVLVGCGGLHSFRLQTSKFWIVQATGMCWMMAVGARGKG
jgi:hypothetical protein